MTSEPAFVAKCEKTMWVENATTEVADVHYSI